VGERADNGLFDQGAMKRSTPPSSTPDWPGLCITCRHAHRIEAARSTFWRCRLSETDARFARYPALPVRACIGHAPMEPELA
jgi:hypothetical protein